ncbi:universal stress protein [Ornithinimicrobium ciconiae]|uniref:Universal stress protein n=1 Tax=Ornithinimicrobium ciconiae TaxID=2594265 RepID=A0A516G8R6_9MICO|nr:universal stress protein [Ornithinimicrobium ciconiae]QDO87872.1 universal stress protein [Ornithinimicrobium ciconiae]
MAKGHVVVGVDAPETSGDAVRWAARTAELHGVPLTMVHAVEEVAGLPRGVVADADEATRTVLRDNTQSHSMLTQAADGVREEFPELEVHPVEVVGDNVKSLLAHQEGALLVVGTGHRNTLSELILGSTSLGVAMHATSPVAVVPPDSGNRDSHGVIMVAVDGSADSAVAARIACQEARARGVKVVAVNTWGLEVVDGFVVTESDQEQFAAIQQRQADLVDRALASARRDYPEVEIEVEIVHDRAVRTLIARSEAADLLVMGSRGLGGFSGKLLGSVSQRILRTAQCPVIIVKARASD